MLRRHVDMQVPEAMTQLGGHYCDGKLGLVKSGKRAARLYERAVELGDVEAMSNLGTLYATGNGVKLSKKKSANFYRMAADAGNTAAQYNLGTRSYNAGDFSEAMRLYGLAAAQGHTNSEYELAVCYETGRGVPVNFGEAAPLCAHLDEAKRLYALAAAKGHERAKSMLANLEANRLKTEFRMNAEMCAAKVRAKAKLAQSELTEAEAAFDAALAKLA